MNQHVKAAFLIQKSIYDATVLISQNELSIASELLGRITSSLSETRKALASGNNSDSIVWRIPTELMFVPMSKDQSIACPEWEDEFFAYPFSFIGSNVAEMITDQLLSCCTAACLFNLGLCSQLSARNGCVNPTLALRNARCFYEYAWMNLKEYATDATARGNSISFLLMAICTNLAKCCYDLSDLEASNRWLACLQEFVKYCWLPEDDMVLELVHNFFLVTSATNSGYIAAGAA